MVKQVIRFSNATLTKNLRKTIIRISKLKSNHNRNKTNKADKIVKRECIFVSKNYKERKKDYRKLLQANPRHTIEQR